MDAHCVRWYARTVRIVRIHRFVHWLSALHRRRRLRILGLKAARADRRSRYTNSKKRTVSGSQVCELSLGLRTDLQCARSIGFLFSQGRQSPWTPVCLSQSLSRTSVICAWSLRLGAAYQMYCECSGYRNALWRALAEGRSGHETCRDVHALPDTRALDGSDEVVFPNASPTDANGVQERWHIWKEQR